MNTNDTIFMRRCLQLAEKGKGTVAPNPLVGAVLVHEGKIIGEGWHQQYGAAHAEVNCFESVAKEHQHLIAESTLYVSLEPCSHYGKTPPCAERIIKEGVKKIVVCNDDPFEKVAGRGFQLLRENGVAVKQHVLDEEGKWQNRRFFSFHQFKRPYIILKWAQTNDGFIAPLERSRFQITNSEATALVHRWRTEEAAIMVGFTTAMNDNPQLTARYANGKQPLRIALDRRLQLPQSHHLFDGITATWILNEQKSGNAENLTHKKLNFDENILPALLTMLHEHQIQSVIVEGGAKLLDSFIQADLWDEARIFTGSGNLGSGIKAPLLTNAENIFSTTISDNRLQVFLYKKSSFSFSSQLPL